MLVIGFANQYYTLWDCNTEITHLQNGGRMIKERNIYIKNISIDKDKAFALYPDAEFDETLRGHTRSFSRERKEYPDNVFSFGRYEGWLFTECSDYKYMAWYFENTTVKSQEYLKPILEKNGYYIYLSDYDSSYMIMTAEMHNKELCRNRERNEARKRIMDGIANGYLELFIENNINDDLIYFDWQSEYKFKFKEGNEYYYKGYTYYLPVLNGKSKRIKNKTIVITDAIINGDDIIINDFIVKK